MSVSKGKAASQKAHLEQKNVTAAEDNKQAGPAASSPQEAPEAKPPEIKVPAEPPATLHQEETAAAAKQDARDEQPTSPPVPVKQDTRDEQPTSPPATPASNKTRPLPERMLYELRTSALTPPAPATGPSEPLGPAAPLTDMDWMPPAEDQVARFLSNVADIAPPPVREREGQRAPGFFLHEAISPEEVKRKKAKAEPFWSQVVATPMEQPTPPSHPARPRRARRQRLRIGKKWLLLIGGILVLLVIALALLLLIHAGLLHR
jgi:hypothetical protein